MIPFLEVSHLASSTSFFSTVLQPLGLYFIQVPVPVLEPSPPRTVTFGEKTPSPTPVLQLREVATSPPKISHVVFAASSRAVVNQVRACAARAKGTPAPIIDDFDRLDGPCGQSTITDLDGNIMEFVSRHDYSPSAYADSPVRHTQSTTHEARRIVNWNYDVAMSDAPWPSDSADDRALLPAPRSLGQPTTLRRSVTTSTYEYPIRPDAGGIGAASAAGFAAAGALVGAGIGALMTYSTLKSDRIRAPLHEFEAPPVQRRSTYPERLPSERGRSGRYIEVERTTRIRYPEDSEYLPHASGARYVQAGSTARSRAIDDMYHVDGRSTRASRYEASRAGTSRTRSQAPTERDPMPLLLTEAEHRSQASSRPSHHSHHSHHSHRSDARSSATVRPPPPPAVQVGHVAELVTRNKPRSRVTETQTTIRIPPVSGSHVSRPPNASRSHSIISARHVPLPRGSLASSSRSSAWEDIADGDSVAPSDSISCAGRSRRSRSYN
jgi:hypothetical protein